MAACGRSSVTLLCLCSVVVVVVLLMQADGAAAAEPQTSRPETASGIIGSAKVFYLRGNPVTPTENSTQEPEKSVEDFARRELDDYGGTAASANCDKQSADPTCTNP